MFDFGEPISGGSAFQIQQNIDIGLIPLILAVVALVIHIAFAVGVFKDSARRKADRQLGFVAPIFLACATLVGSVFVAVGFLRKSQETRPIHPNFPQIACKCSHYVYYKGTNGGPVFFT